VGSRFANDASSSSNPEGTYRMGLAKFNNDIRDYFDAPKNPMIGGHWLNNPEVPSPAEIMDVSSGSGSDKIRPNKTEGGYSNNEDYLKTQYNLLREVSTLLLEPSWVGSCQSCMHIC
jgi:hypothetical protein